MQLNRVILYVHDVARLVRFYREMFALPLVETIEGEWAVFDVGPCQLALHRVGRPYRAADPAEFKAQSNAKLVLSVEPSLAVLRDELLAKGVRMRELKSYPGLTGLLCDGEDPEGNVFQLAEREPPR